VIALVIAIRPMALAIRVIFIFMVNLR